MQGGYDVVKQAGGRPRSLYYNQDCWASAENGMFVWAKPTPQAMSSVSTVMLVSYYEDDCNDLQPA
jgi:hypothetical protein